MMTAEQLRASILQLAMQGKLVPQVAYEGTGEELYKRIGKRNTAGTSSGRKGKGKISIAPIEDSDIPFDIPDSWKWVRLGTIGYTNIGLTYSPKDISTDGTIVLRSSNIQDGHMDYSDIVRVSTDVPNNKMCHKGDILICARNGSKRLVGKAAIINADGMSFGAFMAIFRSECNNYIYHVINSAYFRNSLLGETGTTTINQITQDMLKNVLIPLPPLAEQKRIVAKIEELMPFVQQYATASTKLNTLNANFPDLMKKSILQEAVQGKLVPQDPSDEPASVLLKKIAEEKKRLIKEGKIKKQKPLPEITEDEIPFDIPESWEWCHVGDIFEHNTGKAMNSSAKQSNKRGSVRKFITTSNLYWNRFDFSAVKEMFFSDDELARCTATKRDILMCEGGAYYGRTAIWDYDYDICFQNHIHRLRSYVKIKEEFYYYLFYFYRTTGLMKSKGTAMPGLSSVVLHNLVIPLPPLSEQERIVKKIEELMPSVEKLSL